MDIGHDADGLSLRVGRQPLNYGSQRLISNPQWLNSTRAWDAVRLHYASATWELDLFTGSPVTFTNNQWNKSDTFNSDEALASPASDLAMSMGDWLFPCPQAA